MSITLATEHINLKKNRSEDIHPPFIIQSAKGSLEAAIFLLPQNIIFLLIPVLSVYILTQKLEEYYFKIIL